MESPSPAPLTPEQISAVSAGGGYARCEDPKTHVIYHLIQQPEPHTVSDDYIRQKIEEAYIDAAEDGFAPLDMTAIKAELQRRLAAESQPAR